MLRIASQLMLPKEIERTDLVLSLLQHEHAVKMINARNKDNLSALENCCTRKNNEENIQLLLAVGAKVDNSFNLLDHARSKNEGSYAYYLKSTAKSLLSLLLAKYGIIIIDSEIYFKLKNKNLLAQKNTYLIYTKQCDIIFLTRPFTNNALQEIPIKSNAAYVRYRDELFYINKMTKESAKIEINHLEKFDADFSPSSVAKTLSREELRNIELSTYHSAITANSYQVGYFHQGKLREIVLDDEESVFKIGSLMLPVVAQSAGNNSSFNKLDVYKLQQRLLAIVCAISTKNFSDISLEILKTTRLDISFSNLNDAIFKPEYLLSPGVSLVGVTLNISTLKKNDFAIDFDFNIKPRYCDKTRLLKEKFVHDYLEFFSKSNNFELILDTLLAFKKDSDHIVRLEESKLSFNIYNDTSHFINIMIVGQDCLLKLSLQKGFTFKEDWSSKLNEIFSKNYLMSETNLKKYFTSDSKTHYENDPISVIKSGKLNTTSQSNSSVSSSIFNFLSNSSPSQSTSINNKQEKTAYHYLGLADDKAKIEYNRKDIMLYMKDWLAGIDTSQRFVLRAIESDLTHFMALLYDGSFSKGEINKLIELAQTSDTLDGVDIRLIASHGLKQDISSTSDPAELATIIRNIHEMKCMADIFSNNEIINLNLLKVILLLDHEIIQDFCSQIRGVHINRVANLLFPYILINSECHSNALSFLIKLREQQGFSDDSQEIDQIISTDSKTIIKLDKEILLDYYINSILQDGKSLLDLACTKNPKQFATLFCEELTLLTNHSLSFLKDEKVIKTLNDRAQFYRELMSYGGMAGFFYYDDCLRHVKKAFEAARLQPISLPNFTNSIHVNDFYTL